MRESIGIDTYLTLDTGGGLFAVPICDVRSIVIGTQAMHSAVLPHMPDCVKCIAMVDDRLTTIITMPGEKANVHILGKPIVILAHPKYRIGVIANSVDLIAIPEKGITVDHMTGTKTYKNSVDNIFSIIDIRELLTDEYYSL